MFKMLLRSHLAFFLYLWTYLSLVKSNYTLDSPRRVCKQKIEMYNYLKIVIFSGQVRLTDFFRILKALIILFLLIFLLVMF